MSVDSACTVPSATVTGSGLQDGTPVCRLAISCFYQQQRKNADRKPGHVKPRDGVCASEGDKHDTGYDTKFGFNLQINSLIQQSAVTLVPIGSVRPSPVQIWQFRGSWSAFSSSALVRVLVLKSAAFTGVETSFITMLKSLQIFGSLYFYSRRVESPLFKLSSWLDGCSQLWLLTVSQ